MKHITTITSGVVPRAQLESILQVVGLAQALLALYTSISNTFGIPIPQKNEGGAS